MLTVSNLRKTFGAQSLFEGVSFHVGPGERVGLVGRNGHGKTTLFRIILGQEPADGGSVAMPPGYRVGHLAQHLDFRCGTVLEEAAGALPAREDGTDETYRAKAVLSGLGFEADDLGRGPRELSGGFQVRLSLARLLLSDADLLLLDEPTNYLDVVSIRWLAGFLRGWKRELLLVTHDRDFMDGVTTHTMAIHRGRVRKLKGGTGKLYDRILQEEEVHERTRANDERKRAEAEGFIARFRAQATKARAVQSRIKALARHERLEKLAAIDALDFAFAAAPFAGRWMAEVSGLGFAHPGGPPLFEGLSFAVGRRDRIAVVGPNGRGKTTLLRLLAGELSPTSGTATRAPNLSIGYFGQTNVDRLSPGLSVEEEIRQANPALSRTQVRTLCGAMMFEGEAAEKRVAVLSGGEKSRVLLGKILATPVNLLLLDEATNHLDQESVDAFLEAVSAFEGAVIFVTHVERVLKALATRLVVFDGGAAGLFEGGYADFLSRVGWRAERAEAAPPESSPARGARREMRRQRAQIVARRARELTRLREGIAAREEEIVALEERIARDEAAIVEAARRNDGDAVRMLRSSAAAARQRIDALFDEMAALGDELLETERAFDAELSER